MTRRSPDEGGQDAAARRGLGEGGPARRSLGEGGEPVLDLATLIERPTVRIDGEDYGMLSPEEISIVDHQRFAAAGRRLDELMHKQSLSEREEKELRRLVEDLAERILVEVPAKVRARMSEAQQLDVVEVFTGLLLRRKLGAAGAISRLMSSTGERPPPGSNGSTAAPRRGGSTRRPSPSSGPTS